MLWEVTRWRRRRCVNLQLMASVSMAARDTCRSNMYTDGASLLHIAIFFLCLLLFLFLKFSFLLPYDSVCFFFFVSPFSAETPVMADGTRLIHFDGRDQRRVAPGGDRGICFDSYIYTYIYLYTNTRTHTFLFLLFVLSFSTRPDKRYDKKATRVNFIRSAPLVAGCSQLSICFRSFHSPIFFSFLT